MHSLVLLPVNDSLEHLHKLKLLLLYVLLPALLLSCLYILLNLLQLGHSDVDFFVLRLTVAYEPRLVLCRRCLLGRRLLGPELLLLEGLGRLLPLQTVSLCIGQLVDVGLLLLLLLHPTRARGCGVL